MRIALNRIEEYLKEENMWYRFIWKEETVHTKDASKATGIDLHRITKNLVCQTAEGEYVLLIIPGDRRVNLKLAADALMTKNVSLLAPEEAEKITGYPPGGTPSIGHKLRMRVVFDSCLLDLEKVFCGGGSRDRLLELRVKDILEKTFAIVAEICTLSSSA